MGLAGKVETSDPSVDARSIPLGVPAIPPSLIARLGPPFQKPPFASIFFLKRSYHNGDNGNISYQAGEVSYDKSTVSYDQGTVQYYDPSSTISNLADLANQLQSDFSTYQKKPSATIQLHAVRSAYVHGSAESRPPDQL